MVETWKRRQRVWWCFRARPAHRLLQADFVPELTAVKAEDARAWKAVAHGSLVFVVVVFVFVFCFVLFSFPFCVLSEFVLFFVFAFRLCFLSACLCECTSL